MSRRARPRLGDAHGTGSGRRPRRRFLRLGLVLAGLALPLALLEAGLRAAGYEPVKPATGGRRMKLLRASENPDIAYGMAPGASGRSWGCEVETNSHGFRDREFAVPRPEGLRRIAVIGDSLTFGVRIAAKDTYPEQLEALLEDRGVEVLNLGVGGYDIINEAALLEELAGELDCDLVLVGLCINDLGVHSINLRYIEGLERYTSPLYRLRILQYVGTHLDWRMLAADMGEANEEDAFRERYRERMRSIADDMELAGMIRALEDALHARPVPEVEHTYLREFCAPFRLERLRYGFEWLARVGAEEDVPVVLVPLPFPLEGDHPEGYALAWGMMRHLGERAGLEVLTIHDAFAGRDLTSHRTGGKDYLHLDEQAHAIIAAALEEQLAERFDWLARDGRSPRAR